MKTNTMPPDRITLLYELQHKAIGAYGVHYQESTVSHTFPLHLHTFYELELLTGGTGTQWINGHSMPLEPGSFYLLSPTDLHRLKASSALTFYSIKLSDSELLPHLNQLLQQKRTPVTSLLTKDDYQLCRTYYHSLKASLSSSSPYTMLNVTALVTLLLTMLYSTEASTQTFKPDMVFHRQSSTLKYIHSNYLKPMNLTEVARVAGLSPNHFCSQFKKVAGCGFIEYLTRLRVQHACALLSETDMNITDIAFTSGFGSLSHFLRTFHKYKHSKPSAYRHAAQVESAGMIAKSDRELVGRLPTLPAINEGITPVSMGVDPV